VISEQVRQADARSIEAAIDITTDWAAGAA
jgi:hypothetical protein